MTWRVNRHALNDGAGDGLAAGGLGKNDSLKRPARQPLDMKVFHDGLGILDLESPPVGPRPPQFIFAGADTDRITAVFVRGRPANQVLAISPCPISFEIGGGVASVLDKRDG